VKGKGVERRRPTPEGTCYSETGEPTTLAFLGALALTAFFAAGFLDVGFLVAMGVLYMRVSHHQSMT
jgi:hypothetical protein